MGVQQMSNGEIKNFFADHWGKLLAIAFTLGTTFATMETQLIGHDGTLTRHVLDSPKASDSKKTIYLLRTICRQGAEGEAARAACDKYEDE
jgi:hypothetical protein